jgi:hypothetical protein
MMEGHGMSQEHRKTARQEEINQAARRVGARQHRLDWAIRFSQEPLDRLSPGQLVDRRLELKAFLMFSFGIGGTTDARSLPSDKTMEAVQHEWARIIGGVLQGENVLLGRYTMTTNLMWLPKKRSRKLEPRFVQLPDYIQQPEVYQASCGLAMLIDELWREGRVVKVCPAPKPRAPADEHCNRRFLGRLNQTYCSPACRNLANTRATRAKPQQKRRRRAAGKE